MKIIISNGNNELLNALVHPKAHPRYIETEVATDAALDFVENFLGTQAVDQIRAKVVPLPGWLKVRIEV